MLLEDVGFYERRSVSFRVARSAVTSRPAASCATCYIGDGGAITELEIEQDGERRRISPAGTRVAPTRATAA